MDDYRTEEVEYFIWILASCKTLNTEKKMELADEIISYCRYSDVYGLSYISRLAGIPINTPRFGRALRTTPFGGENPERSFFKYDKEEEELFNIIDGPPDKVKEACNLIRIVTLINFRDKDVITPEIVIKIIQLFELDDDDEIDKAIVTGYAWSVCPLIAGIKIPSKPTVFEQPER